MNFLDFSPHLKGNSVKWRKFYRSLKKNKLECIHNIASLTRADLDSHGLLRSDWPIIMAVRNWVEKNLSYPELLIFSFLKKEQKEIKRGNTVMGYWIDKGQYTVGTGNVFRSIWAIHKSKEDVTSSYLLNGMEWLLSNQNKDGGFPPYPESFSDTAATARILYILFSISKSISDKNLERRLEKAINKSIEFLLQNVEQKGNYCGWHLVPSTDRLYEKEFSIAATSIVIYSLMYVEIENETIKNAIKWLLTVQNSDGGWPKDEPRYDETFWTLRAFSIFQKVYPDDDLNSYLNNSIKKAIDWIKKTKKKKINMLYWGDKKDFQKNIYAIRYLLQCPSQIMQTEIFNLIQKGLMFLLYDLKNIISSRYSFYEVISHLAICIQEFKEKFNIKLYKDFPKLYKPLKDKLIKIQPFYPRSLIYEETISDKIYDSFQNIKIWKIFDLVEANINVSGLFGIIIAWGLLMEVFPQKTLIAIINFCHDSFRFIKFPIMKGLLLLLLLGMLNLVWITFKIYINKQVQDFNMYIICIITSILFILFNLGSISFSIGIIVLILLLTFIIDIISSTVENNFEKIIVKKRK